MHLDSEAYVKYQCPMIVAYIVILIFGIVLATLDFGTYGEVVYHETKEWDKGAIQDIQIMDSPMCPTDYELLSALYLGTETYCLDWYGNYRLGTCSSSSNSKTSTSSKTIYGFADTLLT